MNNSYSLTTKFQVTIPKQLRDELHLTDKDRVSFERRGQEIVLKKVPALQEVAAEMAAKFKASGLKPATDADFKQARDIFYERGGRW